MRTESNSMSIVGVVIAIAIVLGLSGVQAVGLLTGGLVGCLRGVVLPLLVAWSKRRG